MILIKKTYTKRVLEDIVTKGELNKPGRGMTFVVDISMVAGIVHMGDALPRVP